MKSFQKTVEDFVCEHCGKEVFGNGFTNHCPECLWSKHVDINPGDRMESCGGMMRPDQILVSGDEYDVLQICEKCGYTRKNKIIKEDNFETVLKLSKEKVEEYFKG